MAAVDISVSGWSPQNANDTFNQNRAVPSHVIYLNRGWCTVHNTNETTP